MTVSPAVIAERYRLREPLGSGGMGRVWLAHDEVLHREVAIKEVDLPAGLAASERAELQIRTLREARTAARLSHPNVVQIYDVIGADDRPWIVMEYIRSRSLQQVLSTDGRLPPGDAARIGLAVLDALNAAHRAGVLHRDVKPGNVLLGDDGRVVLTDFGLATFDGAESAVTRPGLVWGSPEYVAPERAKHGASSVEADLWSLGATLYAAVEGTSPFARSTAMATLTALAVERLPVPQHAGPLKPVLTGLLRKDPRARLRPQEVERMLRRAAGEGRGRGRRIPRQRNAPAVESAEVAAIPAYPLPAPEMDPVGPAPGPGHQLRPSRRAWAVAVAAVAVMAAIAGSTLYLADGDRRVAVTPSASASPAPSRAETVVVSPPLPGEPAPPDGWTYHREPGLFRIAVPVGWLVERDGRVVRFRESATGLRQLAVEVWPAPPAGAFADTRRLDEIWAAGGGDAPPNFRRIRLDPITTGDGGADWEYSYDHPQNGKAMQVLSRRFTAGPRCVALSFTGERFDSATRSSFFNLAVAGLEVQRP